jgi:hypothetical protein
MNYLRVRWKHSAPDYPTLLYSELDHSRYETRKIDIYPDGRWGYADGHEEVGGTGLGEKATPSVAELNENPEFEAKEIEAEEFEKLWEVRRAARVMTPFPLNNEGGGGSS